MKVLVFGDSQSNYIQTFEKAKALSKKQKFDCLLCLGNLFTAESDVSDLVNNAIDIPITTYFVLDPSRASKRVLEQATLNAGQICDNLFSLGAAGRLTLSEGAKITFHGHERSKDLEDLLQKPSDTDILISDSAPSLTTLDKQSVTTDVLLASHPKYHFYPGDQFIEHKPYINVDHEGGTRITREICLAPVANAAKVKWFYAFNLTDEAPGPTQISAAVANPYLVTPKKKRKLSPEPAEQVDGPEQVKRPPQGYVCKLCSEADDHYYRDCPHSTQKRHKSKNTKTLQGRVNPESCYFCLSNPNLARHLIVSIGDAGSYLALPKGGMTQNHVLIIPIDHKPTLMSMQDARSATETEMNKYIHAIQQMYESQGTVGVLFEISRSTGVHFHIQMLPVPSEKLQELEDAFLAFAETEQITLERASPKPDQDDYFRVLFPSTGTELTGSIKDKKNFDLQFGRRVIADVMGVPERAHWKSCVRTDEQETADAETFKSAFKKFDFT